MNVFIPAAGTRVTVDGREWEFASRPGSPFLSWWYGESNCGVTRRPLLDRIAELEARLAPYDAIGEKAAEHVGSEYPSNTLFNHAAQGVADKLATLWRAQRGTVAETPTILEEAQSLVYGDRQAAYGHPHDDYSRTARMWEAILNLNPGTISPRIACLMMMAVKISREVNLSKRDNLVDAAGYAACAQMCAEREHENTPLARGENVT